MASSIPDGSGYFDDIIEGLFPGVTPVANTEVPQDNSGHFLQAFEGSQTQVRYRAHLRHAAAARNNSIRVSQRGNTRIYVRATDFGGCIDAGRTGALSTVYFFDTRC